jgi:hypothetical protein
MAINIIPPHTAWEKLTQLTGEYEISHRFANRLSAVLCEVPNQQNSRIYARGILIQS